MIRESHEVSRVTNTHAGCLQSGPNGRFPCSLKVTHMRINYQVCGTLTQTCLP